jgi:hypothetical protein
VAGAPGGGAPELVELRVVAPDGAALDGDAAFAPGATVAATTVDTPVPAVGRYDVDLAWRFEARAAGGAWRPVPGAVTTRHRLYGLVAAPRFDRDEMPHRAWVEVVDTVAGWVAGETADPAAVAAIITERVYADMDLRYDRASGASAYTEYPGSGFEEAVFDLSAFVQRAYGDVINCSDAASIVATYATMAGVDLRYHILEHRFDPRFDLNFIRAIGWDEFDETPFFSGGGGFRYHAVVGPGDGTVYDATLELDGDGTPTAPPHTGLLARGLKPVDYLTALSSEYNDIAVDLAGQARLR